MDDPVLSQLVTVESDLTEQIEQLEAQLSQLQIKRKELLSVIDMFNNDALGKGASDESTDSENTDGDNTDEESTGDKNTRDKSDSQPRSASKSTGKASATKKGKPSASTKSAAKSGRKSKPASSSTKKKKKDGRAAVWQKYVQTQYKNLALPEAVSSVLRSNPSEVFKIVDVMSSIFKDSMPKMYYLKARNRISNILSAGARDGTWYRGHNGRYSQSESVTQD